MNPVLYRFPHLAKVVQAYPSFAQFGRGRDRKKRRAKVRRFRGNELVVRQAIAGSTVGGLTGGLIGSAPGIGLGNPILATAGGLLGSTVGSLFGGGAGAVQGIRQRPYAEAYQRKMRRRSGA